MTVTESSSLINALKAQTCHLDPNRIGVQYRKAIEVKQLKQARLKWQFNYHHRQHFSFIEKKMKISGKYH
jgi:hypothetical protein